MSGKKFGNKKMVADLILVVTLLVVTLFVFLIIELSRSDGAYAVVSVDGEEFGRYSLDVDGEYDIGGTNTLVIKDGEAYMTYASCPDELCVKTGKKSKSGQTIVCLPNRVMVEIIGADSEMLEI